MKKILLWIRAARLYQWLKNILLGVPLFTSLSFNFTAFRDAGIAFFAFGLVASGNYILNDLLDRESDRRHPEKKHRPFAARDLPVTGGFFALVILIAAGLGIATRLPVNFLMILVVYLAVTTAYSVYLKNIPMLDVILLAGLYTIRIIAGAAAIGVELSSWLLTFSMFIFLNLAMVKRCSELALLGKTDLSRSLGRDYRVADSNVLTNMGIASGYVAIVVLALFIDSESAAQRYSNSWVLWLLCPLLLYWVSRLWLKTSRNEILQEPLLYSLRDITSWVVFVLMILVVLTAI